MKKQPYISIVTPVYGCAESLILLYQRLVSSLSKITDNFEIIMVNDDSPDHAWQEICNIAENDRRVKGIRFSRNFGQHHAISAGLNIAGGDWVIVMDCDLQDQPEEIKRFYQKAQEGYHVVIGQRIVRRDGFFKKLGSKLFYRIFDYLTDQKNDESIANFGIYSKKVISYYREFKEHYRFFPFFINWIGFTRAVIQIDHAQRETGKSSYNFSKLFKLATDTIVSYSNKPLRLSIKFGFSIAFLSLLYIIWLIIKYFVYGIPVEGWTSVMVSMFLMGGLIIANLGILGLYLGKIYDEAKNRPLYIIEDTINC